MTIGTKLPVGCDVTGRLEKEAAGSVRKRASGPVSLGSHARLELAVVELSRIRGPHPALSARDSRLDLAGGSMIDFASLAPEVLDVFLCSAPMWCIQRGAADDRHFLVVAGAELLPALRRALPPNTSLPVVIVDAKLKDRRWLEIAAVHAASIATLSAGFTDAYVQAVLSDAQIAGIKRSGTQTSFP